MSQLTTAKRETPLPPVHSSSLPPHSGRGEQWHLLVSALSNYQTGQDSGKIAATEPGLLPLIGKLLSLQGKKPLINNSHPPFSPPTAHLAILNSSG